MDRYADLCCWIIQASVWTHSDTGSKVKASVGRFCFTMFKLQFLFVCTSCMGWAGANAKVHLWESQDNLWGSICSF